MASDSGGNINLATTNYIPAGSQSLVMMSNFWLLARVMRPRVAAGLGLAVTDFDTPLRLNHNVPAPGGEGILTRLEARIEGSRIRVDGRATASGTGWSAVSNFNFFIDLTLSGGAITVTAATPSVDSDVDLEWWAWLLSPGLGGLFGGIPSISLGPIGSGLSLDSVILDDLELRCAITRSLPVPVKTQGSQVVFDGFCLDLDTGAVSASEGSASDLTGGPGNSLRTAGPARLTVTGSSFPALTPVQVSRMPLGGTWIPAGSISASVSIPVPFYSQPSVVFGMRTSDASPA